MKYFLLPAFLLALLNGCIELTDLPAGTQPLIFQSEYVNHAWGYAHNGWMMDGSGTAKRFQKTAPWVFPDSAGYVSEADMQKNLAACDSVIEYITADELSKYSVKALSCSDGPMTTPKQTMADAGEHIYAFYRFESDKKRYKRVILSMVGDFSQENLAPNSKEVVEWMMKIK
jgi:hypothetical protein